MKKEVHFLPYISQTRLGNVFGYNKKDQMLVEPFKDTGDFSIYTNISKKAKTFFKKSAKAVRYCIFSVCVCVFTEDAIVKCLY